MATKKVTKKKHGGISGKPHIMRPCPFCGKKPKHLHVWSFGHRILCDNVKCEPIAETAFYIKKIDAITIWNTRA